MNSKLEFILKPVSGAASSEGGYRAFISTEKGNAVDLDGIIAEARDFGYITGIKDEAAKSIVRGVLDSMIAGVIRDGRTRRLDEYLSVSLKVHGRFADKHDEFDPKRHKLALSVKQLAAFRPSFEGVEATNVDHKRQFRIYSVKTAGSDLRGGRLVLGRDFVIRGADFRPGDNMFGVSLSLYIDRTTVVTENPPILSADDGEIRCAWPEGMKDDKFYGTYGDVAVYRCESEGDWKSIARREARVAVLAAVGKA